MNTTRNHTMHSTIQFFARQGLRSLTVTLALLYALVSPLAGLAQGGESYVYPGTDANTEFTIGNINNSTVAVSMLFYDGSTGESTPNSIILQPGTQIRLSPGDIGLDNFEGSTVISSDLPIATTGSMFESDTSFDHFAPVDSAVELVIPLVAMGSTFSEIAIFNPGDEQARARLILVGESGTTLSFNDRTIDPKRTAVVNLNVNLEARYLVIRTSNFFLGGRPVSAAGLVRSFDPPDDTSITRTDLAYVPARPVLREPTSSRVPLFLSGGGFRSTVQVINDSTAPQTITLTAYDLDGQVVSGGNNPAILELEGRAAHTESAEDLFDISDVSLHQGSILIQGSARLSAAVAVGTASEGGISILTAETDAGLDFAYQTRQVGREFEWLLSLVNTSAQTANLDMTFILDDGTVVSTIAQTIGANSQIASTLAEIFPEAQGNGFVLVHSDTPLLATGVEGRTDGRASGIRRPLPAAADFMSSDPTELFAVGTVRSNEVGLPGVTVRLTGPQAATTLTDAAGTYIFNNLGVGSYTLAAEAIGYTIDPPSRNFSITTESSRDNDFEASLVVPLITDLTPAAAPAGSGAVEVLIEGGPFIAGSVAVLGTTQLATSVVNSQLLQATIPANLLQSPLQLNLTVRNVGVAGNSVSSAPVVFTVGNPPPTLLSLSGQPDPLAVGSGGFTLTITGSGFLPGATVFVDSIPRTATFISDTQLLASVATGELTEGGFLPVFALNPGPAVPSNSLDLVVLNLPPEIAAISPSTAEVRLSPTLPPMAITVTGTGFQDGATVLVDSSPVPTQFVSETMVIGSVPSSLLGVSGIRDIQASNPEPSVGPSFAFPLTLTNPVPILTSVSGTPVFDPSQAGQPQPAPVLLLGANFATNSTAWVSLPCDALGFRLLPNLTVPSGESLPSEYETRRLSPGTMTATVNLECAGDYLFQVRSPQPGGGASLTVILTVP